LRSITRKSCDYQEGKHTRIWISSSWQDRSPRCIRLFTCDSVPEEKGDPDSWSPFSSGRGHTLLAVPWEARFFTGSCTYFSIVFMIWSSVDHRGSVISQDGLQTEFCLHVYALEIRGNDGPLTVFKDQLYRVGTWFDEHSILTQCTAGEGAGSGGSGLPSHGRPDSQKGSRLSHEIETPFASRMDCRHWANGVLTVEGHDPQHPGSSVSLFLTHSVRPHLRSVVVVAFRALDPSSRHRQGNVRYIKDSSTSATSHARFDGVNGTAEVRAVPRCFVGYLHERYVEMLRNWVCTNATLNQAMTPRNLGAAHRLQPCGRRNHETGLILAAFLFESNHSPRGWALLSEETFRQTRWLKI